MRMQTAWLTGMQRFGAVDPRGFEFVSAFSTQSRRVSTGKQPGDERMPTFMRYGTASFGVVFRDATSVEAITAAFVKTIKSVLETCSH